MKAIGHNLWKQQIKSIFTAVDLGRYYTRVPIGEEFFIVK